VQVVEDDSRVAEIHANSENFDTKAEASFKYLQVSRAQATSHQRVLLALFLCHLLTHLPWLTYMTQVQPKHPTNKRLGASTAHTWGQYLC
jgi:hypothetical protein